MATDYVKPTPLRIITKVITANTGTIIDTKLLFNNIVQILVPLSLDWYRQNEG
jgi:hypothetical protein